MYKQKTKLRTSEYALLYVRQITCMYEKNTKPQTCEYAQLYESKSDISN